MAVIGALVDYAEPCCVTARRIPSSAEVAVRQYWALRSALEVAESSLGHQLERLRDRVGHVYAVPTTGGTRAQLAYADAAHWLRDCSQVRRVMLGLKYFAGARLSRVIRRKIPGTMRIEEYRQTVYPSDARCAEVLRMDAGEFERERKSGLALIRRRIEDARNG